MEDDIYSTTDVSLIEDVDLSRQLVSSPLPFTRNSPTNSNSSQKSDNIHSSNLSEPWNVVEVPPETSGKIPNFSMPLKHQENTVDILKKQKFDLSMRICHLEDRLQLLSPSNIDNTLKENEELKINVQKLTQELKKYKKVILELNAALEIVKKPCLKQHGMSQEESDELNRYIAEVERCHEENDRLSDMVAAVSAENVRLRNASRSTHDETDLSRKYRQAQNTIQEQQQQIQALQKKSGASKTQDPYLVNRVKVLEGDLKGQRIENDAMMNDIEQKKKTIKDLQNELNESSIKLFDAKQHIKSKTAECERLTKKYGNYGRSTDELIDTFHKEKQALLADLQSREREVIELETELKMFIQIYDSDSPDKPAINERLMVLESIIQEKDEKISLLTEELNNINKSHDEDIEELEKHISKIQNELHEKNEKNKELIAELQRPNELDKKNEKRFEEQFNDLAVAIRERDVRIATLEGEREAQKDTIQRERDILQEELDDLTNRLQEHEEHNKFTDDISEVPRIKEELHRLKLLDKEWKERTHALEDELNKQTKTCRNLKLELEKTKEKNVILNKFLKAAEENIKSEQRLQKANYELKRKLEHKIKDISDLTVQLQETQALYNDQLDLINELEKKLRKRDNMLSYSLSEFDTLKDRKDMVENILYEQATGTHSFRERSELSITEY